MKAKRLSEIKDLIGSPDFVSWWEALVEARAERDEARERHDELLSQAMLMDFRAELTQKNAIDTLYRAGDLEDAAAQLMVESQELENDSLGTVADYEEQRFRASESWYRVCGLEKRLEALRDQRVEAERRLATPGAGRRDAETDLARVQTEIKRLDKLLGQATRDNEREEQAKARLWQQAEHGWTRSAQLSLLIAEHKVRGRKVRAAAERLFEQAEERKQRAGRLRAEADAAAGEQERAERLAVEVLARACEREGCAQGEEFLYFRQRENPRRAWCVPLVEDAQSYNIEIKPLTIYSIEHKRGVEFIEPAVEVAESEEEGDRRFEEYFLKGRKGRVREEPDALQSA